MNNFIKYIVFAFFCVALATCKKDAVEPPIEMGYNYFPNHKGHWVDYQVDSIVWNDFYDVNDPRHIDTFSFIIREQIDSVFIDNEGRENLKLERFKRDTTTNPWVFKNVWYFLLTKSTAEQVEENQRYIKLVFPVKEGRVWSGNGYNTIDKWDYEYQDANKQMSIEKLVFDSAVTVLQADEFSLISKKYYVEKYAGSVGMIYKEIIDVETDPLDLTIKKGLKYKMQVIAWGDN